MSKLHVVVSLRGRVLADTSFDQDRVRIGRSPDNDIHLDNAALSRDHALLTRAGRVWTIEDVSGRGGVYLNGERVTRRNLNDGDSIALGKFLLSIAIGSRAALRPLAAPAGHDGLTIAAPPAETGPAPGGSDRELLAAHLVLAGGTALLDEDVFLIGSHPDTHLRVRGWFVPARLALIVRGQGGFSLLAAGRPGSVRLNDQPLEGRAWLEDGDRLSFARTRALFRAGLPEGSRA